MKKIIFVSCFLAICSMICSCQREYTLTENGLEATVDSTVIKIQFYSPEVVRVVKFKQGFTHEKKSLAVIKDAEPVAPTVVADDGIISMSTERLKVLLDLRTGAVSYLSADASPLLTEIADGSRFVPKEDIGESTFAVKQSFKLEEDEFIYGLGQLQNGKMSQRDQTVEMIQGNKDTFIPFILSDKGYGMYWDNYSPTVFADSTEATSFDSEVGDCIDYYFMVGDNADAVIANMRDLTGQAPMMPYWTFGYWQSKERYKSQEETVDVVEKYRQLRVPIDGIIQDWQYWGDNYHWNAMKFLNPEFPDPQKMVNDVHELNAHIIISIWSSFGPKTEQYKALNENNMLMDFLTWPMSGKDVWPPDMDYPSGVKVYDAYNPAARDIYWKYLKNGLLTYGFDGWWMDSTEPDHMDFKPSDLDNKTNMGSFRRVRNAYPLMTVGGVYTHQRKEVSDKRIFILTRSAFAGQQRYAANSWSGDVVTDWDVLKKQISAGLNFSLTGIPYWNSDVGGFFVWNFPGGYKNKAYHEIYVRWMQFGAFCPMMRSHGTDTPRELWHYGEEGSWTYDALRKMIELRYSLLPYIYSTSWDVSKNQSSMMRALMMDFADDKMALDISDQYMFGKRILVCPVTEPMYVKYRKEGDTYIAEGEDFSTLKTRNVYLPAGTKWFDFWSGELFDGGQTIEREAPIDIIPLYVKAGSIIPFGPKVQYANEEIGPLTVRIYPGANGSFTFYDDERDNYNYEEGAYATFEMKWDDSTQKLTIEAQQGTYDGMPESRKIILVKVSSDIGAGSPNDDVATKEIIYKGDRIEVQL